MGCPEAVRVSLQDSCSGEVQPGEDNGYVLSCIRNWSVEPLVREGDTSEFVSDCGTVVARDRQDDQLTGYTISFETSKRVNEFDTLVTNAIGIVDDGNTIGTYKPASSASCESGAEESPRLLVEVFYKLAKCVSGINHVRWVLPMAQFKVTEMDKEGTISFYRYTAETGIALANAIGLNDGPFGDFPADVSDYLADRDPDEYTSGFDFEESITITGQCGFLEVPEPDPIVALVADDPDNSEGNGAVVITGENLLFDGDGLGANTISLQFDFNPECGGNSLLFASDGSTSPFVGTVTTWTDTLIEIVFGDNIDVGGNEPCGCDIISLTFTDANAELHVMPVSPAVSITCLP